MGGMQAVRELPSVVDAALAGGQALAFEFVRFRGAAHECVRWSRDDLARAVQRAAGAIAARTAPGDRVIVAVSPGLGFIAAFLGCLAAGRIAVPAQFPAATRSRDAVARLAVVSGASLTLTETLEGNEIAPVESAPSDVAYLQFTSGSTQAPRGAIITLGALAANLAVIADAWALGPEDRGVFWLPPFHDMGLVGAILAPLVCGFPATLMHPAAFLQRPSRWLELISDRRATFSGAPNFAYDLCIDRAEADGLDLSCWRVAVNGAEPVSAATLRRFAHRFSGAGFREAAFAPGYGLAESVLFVSAARAGAGVLLDGDVVSCGPPGAGVEVRIVDDARGAPVAAGETGEIWVAGDSIAAGYWNAPDDRTFGAFLPDETHAFLRTGDLGCLKNGQLYVRGRSKDVIIRAGRKAHAADIEHAIAKHIPGRSAAFAAQERLVVVHEMDAGASALAAREAIVDALGADFDLIADEIVLAPPGAVRVTSSGKVARAATRDAWLAGDLTAARRP